FHNRLGAYGVVAERGVRGNEEIREASGLKSQVRARAISPFVLERLPPFATDIDPGQRPGHGIKPGGIADDVKCELPSTRLAALQSVALDRCVVDVHEPDVVLVLGLVIPALWCDALGP